MGNAKLEKKNYTVSEIAEIIGITRNKTWAYIRKNNIKPVKKTDKIFYFDSSIILDIKKQQHKKQIKNNDKKENEAVSNSVLAVLEKQLEANQETINNLQEMVKKQQKNIEKQQETIDYFKRETVNLRLENREKQQLIEDNKNKQDAISENDLKTDKKRGFLSRLFRK